MAAVAQATQSTAANEKTRNGDIIDGAIARAKLEAGFLAEFTHVQSELFPYGLGSQSSIAVLQPSLNDAAALIETLMDVVTANESGINTAMRVVSGNETKIAALSFSLDGLTSIVGNIAKTSTGAVVDMTLITQTAEKVRTLALSGTYLEGSTVLDSWEKGEIDVLKNQISLVVEASGSNGWRVAQTIITIDQIASTVADVINTNGTVKATIATMVQDANGISLAVESLRGEQFERLDDVLAEAHAGILINSQMVQLEAQGRNAAFDTLDGRITVEKDRISLEVTERENGALTLGSQIVQTAKAINLAVWGANDTPTGQAALSSQIAMQSDSISAIVQSAGTSALLALSINLPQTISATQRAAFVACSGSSENLVSSVYAISSGGYYYISATATTTNIKALRDLLKVNPDANCRLASMITAAADEIFFQGKLHATHIYVDEIVVGMATSEALADLANTVSGKANASALGALAYLPSVSKENLGATIITKLADGTAVLMTDLINVKDLFAKDIDATGSITYSGAGWRTRISGDGIALCYSGVDTPDRQVYLTGADQNFSARNSDGSCCSLLTDTVNHHGKWVLPVGGGTYIGGPGLYWFQDISTTGEALVWLSAAGVGYIVGGSNFGLIFSTSGVSNTSGHRVRWSMLDFIYHSEI